MEHIAPLVESALWVGFAAAVLWRFHKPIDGILNALQKRIETGSSVKAGPFELTDQLRPQDPTGQRQKAAGEFNELQESEPDLAMVSTPGPTPTAMPSRIQARYFQAEDFALRAIQTEYGTTVNRQVTGGADMGFDGVFVTDGRLNIVEVKYVASLKTLSRLRSSIDRVAAAVVRYRWRNAQLLLAVVFEKSEDVVEGNQRLQELTEGLPILVTVRCYSFAELEQRFGVLIA